MPTHRLTAAPGVVLAAVARIAQITLLAAVPGSAAAPTELLLGEEEREALRAEVHRSLAAFMAEPAGSCASAALRNALLEALTAARTFARAPARPEEHALAAELLLAVADAAAGRTCPEVARMTYQNVLAAYIGGAYAPYRRHAEAGLAKLPASAADGLPVR